MVKYFLERGDPPMGKQNSPGVVQGRQFVDRTPTKDHRDTGERFYGRDRPEPVHRGREDSPPGMDNMTINKQRNEEVQNNEILNRKGGVRRFRDHNIYVESPV
jgi:hypothetical protein